MPTAAAEKKPDAPLTPPAAPPVAATPSPPPLYEALLAVQRNLPHIQKDAINPAFRNQKYVSLDSLMPQILPLLNEHGLVLLQMPHWAQEDGIVTATLVTRIVQAATGESVETEMPLILDKQNSQGQGSAITYARRYSILSILGLTADTDDDGNSASEPAKPPAASQAETDNLIGLLTQEGRSAEAIETVFAKVRERNRGVLTKAYVDESTASVLARLAAADEAKEAPAPIPAAEPTAEAPAE